MSEVFQSEEECESEVRCTQTETSIIWHGQGPISQGGQPHFPSTARYRLASSHDPCWGNQHCICACPCINLHAESRSSEVCCISTLACSTYMSITTIASSSAKHHPTVQIPRAEIAIAIMAATYQAFLAAPSASALAPNASINYITTTTAVHEPAAIIKHLQIHQKQVVKKDEKILYAIESDNGVCLETEVTLQFHNGGGAFLPGMDENVIDERIVTFPLVHIVSFDANGKISQMRLYWDQGTLLKQVEAIGRTGRNWPIRDGQNLIEAIKTSVNTTGQASSGRASHNQHDVVVNQHKRGESTNPTRDPHASLALFAPRDASEDAGSAYNGPTFATRPSAKPAPRDYGELFVGEESTANYRSDSPAKIEGRGVKAGAGKHVSGNRLFDEEEAMNTPQGKKTYQQKYDHFAFGNGEDAKSEQRDSSRSNRKSQATFSFEDFATPPKVTEKNKPDYERHWGADFEDERADTKENNHPTRQPARSENERTWGDSPDKPRKIYNTAGDGMGGRKGGYNPILGETEKKIYVTAGDGMGGRKGDYNPILGETEKKIYVTAGDGMGGRKASGRVWGFGDESDPEVEAEARSTGRTRRGQAGSGAGY
jgi:hypothetical protein